MTRYAFERLVFGGPVPYWLVRDVRDEIPVRSVRLILEVDEGVPPEAACAAAPSMVTDLRSTLGTPGHRT